MTEKQEKKEIECMHLIKVTQDFIERFSYINPMIYTSKNEEFIKELNVLRRNIENKIALMVIYKDNGLPRTDPRFRSYESL